MEKLVRTFCETYLLDAKQRPLRVRPLQMKIIVETEEDFNKWINNQLTFKEFVQ